MQTKADLFVWFYLEIIFKSREFMQNPGALNIIVGEDLNYKIPLKWQFQST